MEAMRQGGIDFVLTAHEGSAGFAADVTGRMSGAPGLCIATLGPGATNLTTGVGNAWLDRSPLIAITCNLVTEQLGRRIQMWIDHHALFAPITKASFRLEKGKIAETVNEAIRIAMTEPRGPVHLDLPEDVALAPAREDTIAIKPPAPLPHAPDAAIAKAGELIAKARRPIAVLGSTAMRLANPDLLRQVIERHNLPFATTTMAKGMIDEGPSSFDWRHRTLLPSASAKAASLGRSDRRARLRPPSRSSTRPGSPTCRSCKSIWTRSTSRRV